MANKSGSPRKPIVKPASIKPKPVKGYPMSKKGKG
jgi:hypothetical protein